MASPYPLLEVYNVTVSYRKEPVLRSVSFSVRAGNITGIIGPNGAGKSTLFKAILGLIPMESGEVTVAGQPLSRSYGRIAYIPQREEVDWDFPVTALDVVLMGRYRHIGIIRRPGPADIQEARKWLAHVGLADRADARIGELSGGQRQRVFFARALAQEPDVFFLDEPFVGVDVATEHFILDMMRQLRNQGKTILIINHDLSVVQDYYDYVLMLNGSVVAYGPPSEVFTPEMLRRTYGGRLITFEGDGRSVVVR